MKDPNTLRSPFPEKELTAPAVAPVLMSCDKCGAPADGTMTGFNGKMYCCTGCLATAEGASPSNGPPEMDYDKEGK